MLEDAAGIRRVVLACGRVDLRKGIDGLAMIIGDKYGQNPFEQGTLFLFCGQRSDRIKGLLWQGTGFLLLYKRLEGGRLSWPRNTYTGSSGAHGRTVPLPDDGLKPFRPKSQGSYPGENLLMLCNTEKFFCCFVIKFFSATGTYDVWQEDAHRFCKRAE